MSQIESNSDGQLTLDEKALSRLKQDMGEDLDMVLEAYVESIDDLLNDIETRTVKTPRDDLHRWAHSLKSSAASIGAMRLSQLAAEMENSFRNRENIDVAAQLESMQNEYLKVSAGLEKLDLK